MSHCITLIASASRVLELKNLLHCCLADIVFYSSLLKVDFVLGWFNLVIVLLFLIISFLEFFVYKICSFHISYCLYCVCVFRLHIWNPRTRAEQRLVLSFGLEVWLCCWICPLPTTLQVHLDFRRVDLAAVTALPPKLSLLLGNCYLGSCMLGACSILEHSMLMVFLLLLEFEPTVVCAPQLSYYGATLTVSYFFFLYLLYKIMDFVLTFLYKHITGFFYHIHTPFLLPVPSLFLRYYSFFPVF